MRNGEARYGQGFGGCQYGALDPAGIRLVLRFAFRVLRFAFRVAAFDLRRTGKAEGLIRLVLDPFETSTASASSRLLAHRG
jgi:hypothetical protein